MNLDTCLRSIQSLLTDAVPDDPQVRESYDFNAGLRSRGSLLQRQ